MTLEWIACKRCQKVTPHRNIAVQVHGRGGKHRFEKTFLLCTRCLQEGREPLAHVVEDYYTRTAGARPNNAQEAMVMAAVVSMEGETFGTIAARVRAARKSAKIATGMTEPQLERVLDVMTRSGLIYRTVTDRTEIVVNGLLEKTQKPSNPCRGCGSRRVVGLYSAFKKGASESKVKVGSYCLSCNLPSLENGKLLGKQTGGRGGREWDRLKGENEV